LASYPTFIFSVWLFRAAGAASTETNEKDKFMQELTMNEVEQVNGAMSVSTGVSAMGVVAAAAGLAILTPIGAGAILAGVIGTAVVDIYNTATES
jgi:hypothetical protein